jgi:spore maturation protein CgeB
LTEDAPHLDSWYVRGKELDVFRSEAELAEKIRFYEARPGLRDQIAAAGHERTRREHTYGHRLKAVLDFGLAARDASLAAGDGDAKAAPLTLPFGAHSVRWPMAALRTLTLWTCRLLWGAQRGPRAARRLTFELSWRLSGEKTFSAAGWPGRMYYDHS